MLPTPGGPLCAAKLAERAARWCAPFVLAVVVGCVVSVPERAPDSPADPVLHLDRARFVTGTPGDSAGDDPAASPPWQARALPDLWRSHGEGDFGYGWYRLEFALDAVPKAAWGIYLEFAHSSFEVRLNGSPIAAAADFDAVTLAPQSSQPQLLAVPAMLLRPGTNRIDVTLRVESNLPGGLSAVEVGPRQELDGRYLADRFWRADLPRALHFTLLVAAAFMGLLWLRRPKETLYPWFAALCSVWALRGFYVASDGSWLQLLHRLVGNAANDLFLAESLLVGCTLLLVVVNRFAGRRQRDLEYAALVLGLLATLVVAPLGRLVSELVLPAWYAAAVVLATLAARTIASMASRPPYWAHALIAAGAAFMLASSAYAKIAACSMQDSPAA